MIRHYQRLRISLQGSPSLQGSQSLQRSPSSRRVSVLAVATVVISALVAAAGPVSAQANASVAIKIAGPSVTYFVDGCPEASISDPGSYGVTFQTTLPNGVTESTTGVRTADRQYTFTTDIRSDDPNGQYLAAATCNAPDGTVSFAFAATAFWVSEGVPSLTPPENDPSDDATTPEPTPTPEVTDPGTTGTDPGDATDPTDPAGGNSESTPTPAETPESPVADASSTPQPSGTPGPNADATPSAAGDANSPQTTGQDPSVTPSPTPAAGSKVTSVQIQPTEATSGETVKTWVQGCPATVDGTSSAVTFSITTPSGAQKVAISDGPGSDGSFSVAIRVPDSPEIGLYSIAAICGLRDGDAFVERREYTASTFEVITKVGLELPASTPTPSRVSPAQPGSSTPSAARPLAQRPAIGFTG